MKCKECSSEMNEFVKVNNVGVISLTKANHFWCKICGTTFIEGVWKCLKEFKSE